MLIFSVGLLTSGGVEGVGFFRYKDQPAEIEYPFLQLVLFPFSFVIGREQDSTRANQIKLNMDKKVTQLKHSLSDILNIFAFLYLPYGTVWN